MTMTHGMLKRFKAFASEKDQQLLMLDLGKNGKLYGYLRKVEDDYFVMDTVRKQRGGGVEKVSRKTGNPSLILDYDEITPEELPAPPAFSILGV
ncbi:MAG: hypothetical protein ABI835_10970 [Chloroflexota bacterium]